MTRKKKYLLLLPTILIFFVAVGYIMFNQFGVVRFREIQEDIDSLHIAIEKLEYENKRLKEEIDSVQQKIPAKIERIAREKYDMKRRNEKVISIEE